MQTALRMTVLVQPGGKIELTYSALPEDQYVDVIVLLPSPPTVPGRSILEVLADVPGHLAHQPADDVDASVSEERDA